MIGPSCKCVQSLSRAGTPKIHDHKSKFRLQAFTNCGFFENDGPGPRFQQTKWLGLWGGPEVWVYWVNLGYVLPNILRQPWYVQYYLVLSFIRHTHTVCECTRLAQNCKVFIEWVYDQCRV